MTKVCVIGAGRWGKNHVRTLNEMGCLGGIVELNMDAQKELLKQYPDIPVFSNLNQPGALAFDAYSVVVPAELHYEKAKFLLENGKHVLVEKPITLNSDDAAGLVQIAEKKKLVLMVGHLLLFHPAYLKMKALVDQGKLGKIEYIYSNRLNLGTIRTEENILWSFAPHDISLFQYFVNQNPTEITSNGGAFIQPHIHDSTMTMIRYPNNIVGHIFVSWLHPFKEHRVVIIGSKGMLSFEDSSQEKEIFFYEKGVNWVNGKPTKHDGPTEKIEYKKTQALENELTHFLAVINKKETNTIIDGEKGYDVLKILETAQKSLNQKGRPESYLKESKKEPFYVHPLAVVDDNVQIGDGSKIWHFTHVQPNVEIGKKCILGQNVNVANNVKIGDFVKIQNNVSVYEGVELEDYVFCGPSMVFTNINAPRSKYPQADSKYYLKTRVKEGASIGANATVVCGHTLGRFCFVGAGAVVTKDVPDFAMVVGNPARIVGWMSEAGEKLSFDKDGMAHCKKSKKTYQKKEDNVKEV